MTNGKRPHEWELHVIKCADGAGEFVPLEDGFVYYWPSGSGALPAVALRALADELDRRNAAWNAEIEAYFEANP